MKASIFYLPSVGSRAEIEAGMAGDAAGPLPAHAERADRAASNSPTTSATTSVELHRAPLPHRGLRALQQPGAARPLLRDADQAHPRRPARHRAAGRQSDPRRRGHRDARPHDRRARHAPASRAATSGAGSTSWRSRRTASHGALPHQHDEIDDANRAGVRGELPDHQEMLDRGDADLRGQVLEGAGRRDAVGRSRPR